MATAIEFNHVGKQYRLGLVSTGTISHDLNRWWQTAILRKEDPYLKIGAVTDRTQKADSDYVWALRDIDFKVEQGDVVGIIGKNGAGKSTLLKLLSKVTGPTVGTIRARGRIASLLEVGTGFHQEMTGRENIFMNGAIQGMTKAEIASKLDEIVNFSGCERYLDTPVKRYSSGMMVRLGFAVAAHLDPEILVVDEVLAVGDAEFQKKAIGKMQEVSRGEGRTVLFVSHNMASVKSLCKNGVLLENGCLTKIGGIDEIIEDYMSTTVSDCPDEFSIEKGVFYESKNIKVTSVLVNNEKPNIVSLDKTNTIKIDLSVQISNPVHAYFVINIMSDDKVIAAYSSAAALNHVYIRESGDFKMSETVELPANLTNGEYDLRVKVLDRYTGMMLDIPKLAKLIKNGFYSEFTNMQFTHANSGYFVLKGIE